MVLADPHGDGLDFKDFHVQFSIRQNETAIPTQADIRIFNVASTTVQKIAKEFTQVIVQAGYPGLFGTIFSGSLVQRRTGRTSPVDTYLDISAYDGDRGHNSAVVNTTIAAGATQADVAKTAIAAMNAHGVTQGYTDGLVGNALPRGRVLYGMARDTLHDVAATQGATWSIQNGKVVMLPLKGYLPGEAVVLTSATGLIGLPQQTMDGIMVRCLLNPLLRVNGLLKIDNASVQQMKLPMAWDKVFIPPGLPSVAADGIYRILSIDYAGDSRGQDWYCDIACIAQDGTVPISQAQRGRGGLGLDAKAPMALPATAT